MTDGKLQKWLCLFGTGHNHVCCAYASSKSAD